MKKISFLIMLLLISSLSLSCGYSATSMLPTHMKTIYIEPFKNKIDYTTEIRRNIYLPLLEVDVREAIVDRFLFNGHLRIAEPNEADLILRGDLLKYDRGGLRFDDNDDVLEYRLHVYVSLEMWDANSGETFWEEPAFAGETTYFVSGADAISEETAVKKAIKDLAKRVVERTLENW